MSSKFTESVIEDAALAWLGDLGYAVLHGPEIEPEGAGGLRWMKDMSGSS